MQFLLSNLTTLNHVWSIQLLIKETNQYGPQYAFKMSMFMCPAVHMSTRSLLRSSSTHKPSDPPLRVELKIFLQFYWYYYIKRINKYYTTKGFLNTMIKYSFGRMTTHFYKTANFTGLYFCITYLNISTQIVNYIKCFHFLFNNKKQCVQQLLATKKFYCFIKCVQQFLHITMYIFFVCTIQHTHIFKKKFLSFYLFFVLNQ